MEEKNKNTAWLNYCMEDEAEKASIGKIASGFGLVNPPTKTEEISPAIKYSNRILSNPRPEGFLGLEYDLVKEFPGVYFNKVNFFSDNPGFSWWQGPTESEVIAIVGDIPVKRF